jgi:hypothetical protein
MFVTLTESNTYFITRPFSDDWAVMSDSDKTKFLTMASNRIEKLPFIGQKEIDDQTTLFPRVIRVREVSDYTIIEATPDEVKWAVYEEAFAIFKYMNSEIYKLREQGVQSASRGGLSEAYETYRPVEELMSVMAKSYLRDWLVQSARI